MGSAAALDEEPAASVDEWSGNHRNGRGEQEMSTATARTGARSTQLLLTIWLGSSSACAAMPPIILGKDLAEGIGATVGSVVLVTSPQGELTPFGMVPKYIRFRVAGIFNSGFFDYDSSWAFIRLADAQELFGLGDVISVIQFKIDDIYRAGDVGNQIEQAGRARLYDHQLDGAEQASFSRAAPGARGYVHHHWADCFCGGAEYSDLAHHDGDGEDERHRRADVDGHEEAADSPRVHRARHADRSDRNGDRPGDRLCHLLGRRALSLYFALARGLFDRLRSFRSAPVDGLIVALVSIGISFVATIYPSWSAARILPAEALRYE